ncbi:MAG: acylphosphatase [Gammaproteobacteria bacterium]|nr:MAG: acylphosphatase [Gammaproteobacteria bacterium]
MTRVARRCLVSGRVQGVFYRASTQERARELGVEGHAINLPDGRVEVLMVGAPEAVEALAAWLWEGPPMARVTDVTCEAVPVPPGVSGFRTGWG